MSGKVFIISAPSGSGKSTLVNELRRAVTDLEFSISYTTRKPRGTEQNGREYSIDQLKAIVLCERAKRAQGKALAQEQQAHCELSERCLKSNVSKQIESILASFTQTA